MKKLYTLLALGFLFLQVERALAQSATINFLTPDTVAYGDTLTFGDISCHDGFIINKTSATITVYVVRVQDVNLATGWESYLCTDGQCFQPSVDSVAVTLTALDSTEFIPHFGTTATPDSQTILMSVRNAANPSDVVYQRFHGVTKIGYGAGIHGYSNLASVSVFPSPALAGSSITMNITGVKVGGNNFTLRVYNMFGSQVSTVNGLTQGNNTLNLDLAAGMYSYGLVSGEVVLKTGTISVSK